ncbi:hypothetical protein BV898_00790 [Hypsibius exemplaris]|uniref:Uncharacterized protein n=1 Tax=Hypsibius exemplaris TaxID=2072580 RepID=A0A1W0XCG3_HYPEX|nr:hypothetical protein BV898_00790 [Hypsibius exemplaris]
MRHLGSSIRRAGYTDTRRRVAEQRIRQRAPHQPHTREELPQHRHLLVSVIQQRRRGGEIQSEDIVSIVCQCRRIYFFEL